MYLISSEGYKSAGIDMLIEKEAGIIWAKMKNVHDGIGLQNMSDPVSNMGHLQNGKTYKRTN